MVKLIIRIKVSTLTHNYRILFSHTPNIIPHEKKKDVRNVPVHHQLVRTAHAFEAVEMVEFLRNVITPRVSAEREGEREEKHAHTQKRG